MPYRRRVPLRRTALPSGGGLTIAEARAAFLKERTRFRNLAPGTVQGYQTVLRSLSRWAAGKGLSTLEELDEEALRNWVDTWTCRPSTTRQRLSQAKAFLSFAAERGWVGEQPLAGLRPPRSDSAPTMPLTVPEMRALLAAATGHPKERALLLLLRYSGLAIGDAVTLRREALTATELTLRRAKSGELVMVDLPPPVVQVITRLRGPSPDHFFWSGRGKPVTIAKYWRARLGRVAVRAQVAGFHPHRLRDTFAVGLLTAGVSMEDVSTLLGHSSIRTTERHYAPWDRRRRDRLAQVVRAANRLDPLLAETDRLADEEEGVSGGSRRRRENHQLLDSTGKSSGQFRTNWHHRNRRTERRHRCGAVRDVHGHGIQRCHRRALRPIAAH